MKINFKNKRTIFYVTIVTLLTIIILAFYLLALPDVFKEIFNVALVLVPTLGVLSSSILRYLDSNKNENNEAGNSKIEPKKDKTSNELSEENFKVEQIEIFLKIVEDKQNEKILRATGTQLTFDQLDKAKTRILNEINRLIKNSNLNLIIALMLTGVAIAVLSFYTFTQNIQHYENLLITFLPKLSISILIEIFAFFFLKMYKNNLDEIKYFQNELTNIDFKIVAIRLGLFNNNEKESSFMIEELIKTERNFILKAGETTVEIEKSKLDFKSNSELSNFAKTIINGRTNQSDK